MNYNQIFSKLKIGINNYDTMLKDNDFLIFFYNSNKEILYKKIVFEKKHFKHLTGIDTSLSAVDFYNTIQENELKQHHVKLKKDGTTRLKLEILDKIHLPFHSPAMIGTYFNFSKLYLKVDEVIGTNLISVGLKNNTNYLIPSSLLKENIKKITEPTFPVLFVLKKKSNDEYFNEITHCKTDFCLQTFFKQNKELITNLPIHNELTIFK